MHQTLTATVAVAAALVASASTALAQYSSNPATPMSVIATAGDDVQCKLAPAPTGSHYISFFSGAGYDVMLDRRDKNGTSVWGSPLLIEDRAFSSTTDYALTSDADGNAYVVYNAADPNNAAGSLVKMAKVTPGGSIAWNSTIYTATIGATSLGNGRATVATDGYVWGAYSVGFDSTVARVNAATGAVANSVFITESGVKQMCSGLQASTDGSVILTTIRYTTISSAKVLRAHRILSNGTRPWAAAGVAAFTVGSVQTGNFPDFIPDGAGGGYIQWYTTSPLMCRLQHVDVNGTMTFGVDGIPVASTTAGSVQGVSTTLSRTNPSSVRSADGNIWMFYRQYSGSVNGNPWYAIGAQCFHPDGYPLLADGVLVSDYVQLGASWYDQQVGSALRLGGDAGVCFVKYISAMNSQLIAARMNADGTVAWSSVVANDATQKYRFSYSATASSAGSVMAWQANAGGTSDIFAGFVAGDGTIGAPSVVGDLNGDGAVNGADLAIVLGSWGPCSGCPADLNLDGIVNGIDLAIVLGHWTP